MNVHRHIHDVVMEGSPSSTTLTVSRRRGTLMKKGLLYIYIYVYVYIYIYIYIYNLHCIYTMMIAQPYELKHCEVVLYLQYRLWGKMASFQETFSMYYDRSSHSSSIQPRQYISTMDFPAIYILHTSREFHQELRIRTVYVKILPKLLQAFSSMPLFHFSTSTSPLYVHTALNAPW